jgi:hypothetical protein
MQREADIDVLWTFLAPMVLVSVPLVRLPVFAILIVIMLGAISGFITARESGFAQDRIWLARLVLVIGGLR